MNADQSHAKMVAFVKSKIRVILASVLWAQRVPIVNST